MPRRTRAITILAVGIAVTGLVGLVPPAANATTPSYEPDPQSVGTLAFYDASGNQITSGSTTTAPMAAYVVGSSAGRAGDMSTLLNMAQPNPNAGTGVWNADTLTGQSNYPLPTTGNPANIVAFSQTRPVSKGTAGDFTVADFISEFPNTGPTGAGCAYAGTPAGCTNTAYQNLYQLRLITANGANQNPQYQVADILVSGTTWTQVYGGQFVVGMTPPSVAQGASGLAVKITGAGFSTSTAATVAASGTGVTFSSVKVSTTGLITAKVAVSGSATLGSRDLTVTQGSVSLTCSHCLTIDAPPTVTGISPHVIAIGATHTVTVTGTGFVAGALVKFTGPSTQVTGKVTAFTSTTLTVSLKASTTAVTGAYTLALTNGNGGKVNLSNAVTVVAAPTISGVNPTSFARGSSTAVTITGTGFTSDATLTLPKGCTATGTSINGAGTSITFTMKVATTAKTGTTNTIKVTNGPLGGFGTATSGSLSIT